MKRHRPGLRARANLLVAGAGKVSAAALAPLGTDYTVGVGGGGCMIGVGVSAATGSFAVDPGCNLPLYHSWMQ